MIKETICAVSMLTGHHVCNDEAVLKAKPDSRDGLTITQIHAGNEAGKTHINGAIEKSLAAGNANAANTHVDIVVTHKGKTVRTIATEFFPKDIPATRQGIVGRSRFAVSLDKPIPADAEITVSTHRQPIQQCPHAAKR